MAPRLQKPEGMETIGALAVVKQALQPLDPNQLRPKARTVTERVGAFELCLTYGPNDRLLVAVHHDMRLTLASDASCGEWRCRDGWEVWSDGQVRGRSSGLSQGRGREINHPAAFEAWRDACLRDLRSQVFFCCCERGAAPTLALAAHALDYAIEHGLLSPGCTHDAAEEATRAAARGASEEQRRQWRRYFQERGLSSYVAALEAA